MIEIKVVELYRPGDSPLLRIKKLLAQHPEVRIPVDESDFLNLFTDVYHLYDDLDRMSGSTHFVLRPKEIDLSSLP